MQAFQVIEDDGSGLGLLQAINQKQWPWLRGEYVMAVLDVAVCADESGIHDDAPVCILSGYIASIQQWLWFDDRWMDVLGRHDVFDFHSKDFFAVDERGRRVGRYRSLSDPAHKCSYGDWPDDQAAAFINGLLGAINQSNIVPIGAYVSASDFWSFTYGERKYLTGGKLDANLKWVSSGAPSKAYFLLYDHCLAEAGHLTGAGKKTLFVFDQQKQFEGRALQQFGESIASLQREGDPIAKRLAGVLFQERSEVLGLQAADLYTHCWYRYIAQPHSAGPRLDALQQLTVKAPGMKIYSRAHMEGLFRNLPANVRDFVRGWTD
jgi:hypothetical protein